MIWAKSQDGSIEYKQLTSKYIEKAWLVMAKSFFIHENVCIAANLPKNPVAINEFKIPILKAMKDGLSFIAVNTATDEVAGVAINKLGVKGAAPGESFGDNLKEKESLGVLKYMKHAENLCNFFDHCKVDCLLEIMFLATLNEYRGKGIGRKLCEVSINLAEKLAKGINVKLPIDEEKLELEPVPKIVTAIFTSFITQRFGRQLGFKIVAEEGYDKLEYEGRRYSDIIGKETPVYTLEYLRIDE